MILRLSVRVVCEQRTSGSRCLENAPALAEFKFSPGHNEPHLSGFWPPAGWACVEHMRFLCPGHAGMTDLSEEPTPTVGR